MCRLWQDEGGRRWARSAKDLGLEILCVSQFTLYHVMKVQVHTQQSQKPGISGSRSILNFLEHLDQNSDLTRASLVT